MVNMEKIAEYLGSSLEAIADSEPLLKEGQRAEVWIFCDRTLDDATLRLMEKQIIEQGVKLTAPIEQVNQCIRIKCQKMMAPLAIIAIVVAGITAVAGGIVGWQIFKATQMGVPIWVWGVGLLGFLYLAFRSEPAKRTGRVVRHAGRRLAEQKTGLDLSGGEV